jgi:hypothetical protein
MFDSCAQLGKMTVEDYKAMSDEELEYELEDMPITESCDVVR